MRQAIQELQPQGAKPGQAGLLWPVFLSALMTLGGLLGLNQTFGEHTPGLLVPVLAGLVALLCCLLGWAFQEKHAVLAALPVLPWAILFAAAGPAALWRGGKLWLNDLFTRWNLAHDGDLSLFQVEGTMGDLLALACLLALLCGCAVWFFVAGWRVLPCGVVGGLVVLLQLLGGTFSPLACALFLGAFLGLWITRDGGAPSRRGVFVWLAAVVLLALGTLWGGSTTLPSVDQLRENMTQGVHDLRSGSRPAELTVAEEWVTAPGNEAQNRYCQAEAVYRDFVYRTYTTVDTQLADLLQAMFWDEYDQEGDGVYRALRQVRDTLNETVTYTKAPPAAPEGEDPILCFLTQSRQGNDVLYASAAVQALRAHGIPARYAEGYYLSASDAANSPDGTVTLTGQNAHAWVEVYFDGVGWLPTDVTPGYYYDTVALQQMVGTPDTVCKTAALEDDQTGAEGVTGEDNGGSEENITPQEAVKNGAIALAGLVGLCLLLACIVLLVLELMRAAVLWRLTQRFRAADAAAQITMLEGQIFTFLDLWGYEASLGWHTEELDATLAKEFTAIEPGEFRRVSRLMERAVYGGLELEEYETRAIRSFLSKISLVKPGDGWKIRRRLRYGWLPIFAKRIHKRKK